MKPTIVTMIAACTLAALSMSCATVTRTTAITMPEVQLDLSSLPKEQYVIIGKMTESASVVASTNAIAQEKKRFALGEKAVNSATVSGDSGNYGFIGGLFKENMTVQERAVALATNKLLDLARYNEADAMLYVTTQVTTQKESGSKSRVTATVSGYAVKITPDAEAKYPQLLKEEEAAPVADESAPVPDAEEEPQVAAPEESPDADAAAPEPEVQPEAQQAIAPEA